MMHIFLLVLLGSSVAGGRAEEPPAEPIDAADPQARPATTQGAGAPEEDVPAPLREPSRADASKRQAIEEIVVQPEGNGSTWVLTEPQAIGIVTRQDLNRSDGLFLEESLNLLPGVRVETRTMSGGQRITIRGYGNGTNFNGTGYKAYLNGIPLTDAEGVTILDDIDVSTLGKIEVIRGPASSLYGSGIAGVLKMFTLRPKAGESRVVQDAVGGSYGLLRTNTRVERGTDNSSVLANYGHQQSDSYRVHSKSKKDYALLSADFEAGSRQSASIYAAYNHSVEQLAGQLTEGQFLGKENYIEPPYRASDAHVAIDSIRFGVSHRYELQPAVSNVSTAYGSGYQLDQPFAAGRSDNLVLNYGGRTEFDLHFGGPALEVAGAVGAEIQQTNSFKKSYNLSATTGELLAIRGDLQVVSLQSSIFTQWDVSLPYEFTVTAGASLNFVHYNVKDRLARFTAVRDFTPVVTPRVAASRAFGRELNAYAQVSQGYSAPGTSSVVISQIGAVNLDLKPERATLYEIGAKGRAIDNRLAYELALFDMVVQDKLTPQAVTDSTSGTFLYNLTVNAGKQNNVGLELATKYALINDKNLPVSLLQPFVSYTLSRFRYDNFKSDNNNNSITVDYSGKKVVGVPAHVFNLGVDAALKWGIYLDATYQYVDSMPLTFDNTHSAKSYSLLSAKLGYRAEIIPNLKVDLFAGGNNLLGSLYYTMVFLNASYVGPTGPLQPNVYLPGPYRATFYGGLNLSYSL